MTTTMKTFLKNVIGLPDDAATQLHTIHGLDLLNAFQSLSNKDIDDIFHTVRKPGGMIEHPDSTRAVPVPDIANPGVTVPAIAAKRLKLCVYGAKHLKRLSRPINYAALARPELDKFDSMQTIEASHIIPPDFAPPSNKDNVTHWLERLDSHLLQTNGVNCVPLAYVIRETVTVPLSATDPATNYASKKLELIARCPHGTTEYEEDEKTVWGILQRTLVSHISYASIRRYCTREQGRDAYLALVQHYCGRSRLENILAKAEGDLHSTFYSAEKVNFTFETYVAIHRNAFNEMDRANNYPTPDEGTRVRQLIANITTRDPLLAAVLASIKATPTLRNNFEDTVDILCQAVRSSKHTPSEPRRISAFNHARDKKRPNSNKQKSKGKKARQEKGPWKQNYSDVEVEDRFYTKSEYNKLVIKQKRKIGLATGST